MFGAVPGFLICLPVIAILNKLLPWNNWVAAELSKRRDGFDEIKRKLDSVRPEYQRSAALQAYEAKGKQLQREYYQAKVDLAGFKRVVK